MPQHLLAALALVGVWSTTALAINWSVHGLAVSAALFGRFLFATLAAWLLLRLTGRNLSLRPAACRAYLIGGCGVAASMLCTYWASRSVSSGMIAVIFGLIPFSTALFARLWLGERLAGRELVGMLLGLVGLAVLFSNHLDAGLVGLLVTLLAVFIQSATAVRLKIAAQELSAMAVNTGALAVCGVVTGTFWLLNGAPLPADMPWRAIGAVGWLALIGSAIGFSLYYWMIRECRPAQVAVLSLVSPAAALWLGHALNAEHVSVQMLAGTVLIVGGLVCHQFGPRAAP
ncbi:DMT family transporter [Andreprevotia chitinilytica]|uniref:DMT family transporter n=1 Tax=Andreprevotia chitinilytica TaxID=396808 RepID=UPI000551E9D1|nr:EamA family transporter [Andreprevotia chitinilytica]